MQKNIRALQALVVVLGLVIVVGLGVLLVAIGRAVTGDDDAPGSAASFKLPAGARVLEIDLDGDRLAVRTELGDGRQAILLFDARKGVHLGTLALEP